MRSSKHYILLTLGLLISCSLWAQQPGMPRQPGTDIAKAKETGTSNVDASKTLNYVNSLFDLYNTYNTKIAVDKRTSELVFSDKFSELRGNFSEVEFRRSGELMGLYCKGVGSCLSVTDVDTGAREEAKVKYTFGLKENDTAIPEMDRAIEMLNEMLADLAGGSSSSGLSVVARNNLQIINDAYDQYNNYETVFSVKGTMLHWDSTVANVKADLNNLTFYIDYKNKWMVMRCTDGDCLIGSSSKDSYSMGLSDSNGIAPNIEKVLQAFNDLRREILTN